MRLDYASGMTSLRSLLFGLALLSPLSPALAQSATPAPRTVTVTGEAEIQVVPDEAYVTLGVESVGKDLAATKKQNDGAVQRVLASVGKNGVKPADAQTDYTAVEPRYDPNAATPTVTGFAVRKNISVKVRDLKRLEAVVSDALLAGANSITGVTFQTSKLREYRDQARLAAIKAAKEKAVLLAGALDQGVGAPVNILEESARVTPYSFNAQNVARANAPVGEDGGTFAPGRISVSASVTVVFELKKP